MSRILRTPWPLLFLAVTACETATTEADFTIDQRIDMAGALFSGCIISPRRP